jgi:opacity protein-like surface antigen
MKLLLYTLFAAAVIPAGAQDFSHFTFEGGGGASLPTGQTGDRLNAGWDVLLGGGYKFNKHLSVLLEYQYNRFSLTNLLLQNANQPDGFSTYWSFTLDPRYTVHVKGPLSVYGTGGYGVYHRRIAFTDPSQAADYCDPYTGFCSGGAPVVAEFDNFKGGFNAGGGALYDLGGLEFFTDVRYHRFIATHDNNWISLSFGIHF